MTIAPLRLDDYRAVADFRAALRAFLRASDDVTRTHGLTPGQYDLLVMLKAAGSRGATMSALADRLSLAANSVTELVNRAQERGLVSRRTDRRDKRVTSVSMTRKGERAIVATVAELHPQRLRLLDLLIDVGERLQSHRQAGEG